MTPLRFLGCIFSDDVRQESSGKYFLVGAYAAPMYLSVFPATVGLCIFVPVENRVLGTHRLEFQFVFGRTALAGAVVETTVEQLGFSAVVVGPIIIDLPAPGDLRVQVKSGSGTWETIGTISAVESPEAINLPRHIERSTLGHNGLG
jgi:hypothetical protein